ncbi:DNA repair protein RecN [Aliarcobacter thereius]|uniref:DNA repair protein RecN n=1 Tax=Aliarcobacter thereius TaxID=544718 RepID=A0A5R9HCC6_9BACT|nr:DNA repair protein RecN [Aliarcobacter thereius]TLS72359.1 DNA recombination protein RecN [Aliarcobacter thereius]TLT07998.1 DNA recombination protein RecN [Aliarcobacter thereius]
MINRIYIKNCLSFKEVELEFNRGLNIFTGPSGAGKSILMQEFLALFGLNEIKSEMAELTINNSKIKNEEFDISFEEDITLKSIKKDKTRYFLNSQTISKRSLADISVSLIKYLSLKDTSDFKSEVLIEFMDRYASKNFTGFTSLKNDFDAKYKEFVEVRKKLEKLREDEKNLEDLKEFAKFEISKIEEVNPKLGEYEELNNLKKSLAKKEKIEQASKKASQIFESTSAVNELLEVLEQDSSFFDEAINELNNILEKSNDTLSELEDINIEETLTRIEQISSLIKKFGSIEETILYKEQKQKELDSYNNISFEKEDLEKRYKELFEYVSNLANMLTKFRNQSRITLEKGVNEYLEFLYLNSATIDLGIKDLDSQGLDYIDFKLNGVSLQTISSGEYNRLRLALLSAIAKLDIDENGILFLDEIDANLSGKESEAIAKVLISLSKNYQIFAISHQIQLTSSADQHFLVEKNNDISTVRELKKDEKIIEIARMISGENVTKEALSFAKNLIKE